MNRLATFLLLLAGLLCSILLIIFAAHPPSAQIHDQVEAASVDFSIDRSQVVLPSDCIYAAWSVEGIREVYIDGAGTVGTGEREICPWDTQPSLRVVFQGGGEKIYALPVRVLTYNGIFWLLLIAAAG